MQVKKHLDSFKNILEKLDSYRDSFLFLFIKPYWPKKITPNHVTYLRVLIGITLCVLLFFFDVTDKTTIVILFLVGILSDFIDGPVARGTNRVTEFGAMLDSTADRILILPIAIYSLFTMDKWLLLVIFIVEIINALTSLFYKSKEIYLESNIFGKTKMVLQSLVFIVILYVWPHPPKEIFFDILWVSCIFSILSILSMFIELKNKGLVKSKIITKDYKIRIKK